MKNTLIAIISFFVFAGCIHFADDEGWRTVTVKKGNHDSNTNKLRKVSNSESYAFEFTESCRYNHNDSDQGDWNKLVGLSQFVFDNHKISMMVAWRYNLDTEMIELAPYQHDYKLYPNSILNRKFFNDNITSINIGEEVKISIWDQGEIWEVQINNFTLFAPKTDSKGYTQILHWFGGQKTAPHDIHIKYKYL